MQASIDSKHFAAHPMFVLPSGQSVPATITKVYTRPDITGAEVPLEDGSVDLTWASPDNLHHAVAVKRGHIPGCWWDKNPLDFK